MIVVCIPGFCLGLGALYLFAFKLKWFPLFGYQSIQKYGFWRAVWSVTLPSLAIGLSGAAGYARHTRSQMLDVLGKDYIRTARSKGMTERVINYRHGLKNVLAVMITMVAGTIVGHLGGSTVMEKVFTIQGVGLLAYSSLTSFDYTQEQAILLFFAAIFVAVNIILDIIYKALDPRIDLA
jgi:peptide/nickel transport system permease protein